MPLFIVKHIIELGDSVKQLFAAESAVDNRLSRIEQSLTEVQEFSAEIKQITQNLTLWSKTIMNKQEVLAQLDEFGARLTNIKDQIVSQLNEMQNLIANGADLSEISEKINSLQNGVVQEIDNLVPDLDAPGGGTGEPEVVNPSPADVSGSSETEAASPSVDTAELPVIDESAKTPDGGQQI